MGLLANDMMRLVGEIHAGRDDRRRLLRDLKYATLEMKRAVAHLRSSLVADLRGVRAAWLGAMAIVPREAGVVPGAAAPGKGLEAEAKTRFGDPRRHVKAKPQARDKARTVRKAGKRPRPR